MSAASASQVFTGIGEDGAPSILTTSGNPDCHVVLRGSSAGPNYDTSSVADTLSRLEDSDLPRRVVIDASHGNSRKDHEKQPVVAADIATRIASGERGVVGVMLESFLLAGRQDLTLGEADKLAYGQSVTDACMDWDTTAEVLRNLAAAVAVRNR